MKKILINNVYSYRNRGDSAIVESTIRFLQETFADCEIYLLSQYWKENSDYYFSKFGSRSVPPLLGIPMDSLKWRRLLRAGLSLGILVSGIGRLSEPTRALYKDATIVIDAGGGSLFSSNKYRFYLGLYQHLFNLWFAAREGIPTIVSPQSIGPFNKTYDAKAAAYVLDRLEAVAVRERISATLLDELGVAHTLVPDMAFLRSFIAPPSATVEPHLDAIRETRRNVGVTVLDWRWARQNSDETSIDLYLQKLIAVLTRLAATFDIKVWIFPQVTAGHGDSDESVSNSLAKSLPNHVPTQLVSGDFTASDLYHLYSRMDAFVGSRMHSCIFALLSGVPTIGLAYQPKTLGTFTLLGLGEHAYDIADFEERLLEESLERFLSNRAVYHDMFSKASDEAGVAVSGWFRKAIERHLT